MARETPTPPRGFLFLSVATGLIVALTVLCGGIGLSAAAEAPGEPASFHGSAVQADGADIPAGTRLVAVVDGDAAAEIRIDPAGEYGGPGAFDDKLRVDSDAGGTVSFRIPAANATANETVPLEPGVSEVALTFPNGTVTTDGSGDATGNSTDGDDGGGSTSGTGAGGGSVGSGGGGSGGGTAGAGSGDVTGSSGSDDAGTSPTDGGATDDEPLLVETRRIESGSRNASGPTVAFEETTVREIALPSGPSGEVSIEELADPTDGAPPLPGNASVVSVSEITVPKPYRTDNATIRAVVSEAYLEERDIDPAHLTVYRLPDGGDRWEPLPTEVSDVDAGYLVAARTPGFSQFVVAGRQPPLDDRPGGNAATVPTPEDATDPSADSGGSADSDDSGGSGRFGDTHPIVLAASLCAILVFVAAVGRFLIPRRPNDW